MVYDESMPRVHPLENVVFTRSVKLGNFLTSRFPFVLKSVDGAIRFHQAFVYGCLFCFSRTQAIGEFHRPQPNCVFRLKAGLQALVVPALAGNLST